MLRSMLIAMLALAQGIPSLASGLTLCLHSDGTFCLESPESDCCGHHSGLAATHDDCCGSHGEHPAIPGTSDIGQSPCDCTHVALLGPPQFMHKVGRDEGKASPHKLDVPSVVFTAPASAVSLGVPLSRRAETAGGGASGALPFLAPVMLRC